MWEPQEIWPTFGVAQWAPKKSALSSNPRIKLNVSGWPKVQCLIFENA